MLDLRDFYKTVTTYLKQPLPCDDQADLFFSAKVADTDRARDMCLDCPLLNDCLQGAKERREPTGVWGGEWFENGAPITRRRPGRPTGSKSKATTPRLTSVVIPLYTQPPLFDTAEPAGDAIILEFPTGQPIPAGEAPTATVTYRAKKIRYPDVRLPARRIARKIASIALF